MNFDKITPFLPVLAAVIGFAGFRFKVRSTLIKNVDEKIQRANSALRANPSTDPSLLNVLVVTELHQSIERIELQLSKWWLFLSKRYILRAWKLSLDTSIIQILERKDLLHFLTIVYSTEYANSKQCGDHFKTLHDQWQYVQHYFEKGIPLKR